MKRYVEYGKASKKEKRSRDIKHRASVPFNTGTRDMDRVPYRMQKQLDAAAEEEQEYETDQF